MGITTTFTANPKQNVQHSIAQPRAAVLMSYGFANAFADCEPQLEQPYFVNLNKFPRSQQGGDHTP